MRVLRGFKTLIWQEEDGDFSMNVADPKLCDTFAGMQRQFSDKRYNTSLLALKLLD